MKRGAYAKTAERRRTILATALEVFAESGFRGASVREIASRVGMTDTGVLHHFGGKGKLLLEVVGHGLLPPSGPASSTRRISLSPWWRRDLTVPTGQPSRSATASRVRSAQ